MNLSKLKQNVRQRVQLRPVARHYVQGRRIPEYRDDDWIIDDVSEDVVRISNIRTRHIVLLGHDHIHSYTSNPGRSQHGIQHSFLSLHVQIRIRGIHVSIEPTANGLDTKKSARAIKFLSEPGFGNQHYRAFLLWAYPDLESAIITTLKFRIFDDACRARGISIRVVPAGDENRCFLELRGNAGRVESVWNGRSYFGPERIKTGTFGAYLKNRHLLVNPAARDDFRHLHFLFDAYVRGALPKEYLHRDISPEGMVPPNY